MSEGLRNRVSVVVRVSIRSVVVVVVDLIRPPLRQVSFFVKSSVVKTAA